MTTYHHPQSSYVRICIYEQDISDWKPGELARLIENDTENNLSITRKMGGKVLLEYLVDVGVN